MGFFSEIAQEARRGLAQQSAHPVRTAAVPVPTAVPDPEPAQPVPAETPVPEPVPTAPGTPTDAPPVHVNDAPATGTPADDPDTPPVHVPDSPAPEPAAPEPVPGTPPDPPEKQPDPPTIDLTPEAKTADDAARRKAHEEAEAKRKAEFDARQAEKRAKRQAAIDRIAAMDDAELLAAAAGRVAAETERITRRNMKEAVAEHVQAACRQDAAFARLAMDPAKSMINCFRYINRQAREYAEQEMKDNGEERAGAYGLDIPDGLVYQWAEDYFNDPDAKEDHVNEETFVPQPYVPARKPAKARTAKTKTGKPKPAAEKPKSAAPVMEQMSLL